MKIHLTKLMARRALMVISIVCLLILIVATITMQAANPIQVDVLGSANMSTTVQVLTAAPSSDSATQIEVSGIWPSGCVPQFESVDDSFENLLIIHAIAEPPGSVCHTAATEWSFVVEFQFDAGPQVIDLALRDEQSDTTSIYSSEIFYVADRLDVAPQNPAPNEPFAISVSGIHQDGCVPQFSSYELVESTIVIDVTTQSGHGPCPQALEPWQVSTELDGMEAGEYAVEVYVTNLFNVEQPERRLLNSGTLLITDAESAAPAAQPEDDASTLSISENSDLREVSYLPFILR